MMTKLLPNERLDDLQIRGYEIIQSPGRFCFGMDAVLLSAFANVKKHEKALDLGTGTGILPILLEAKYPGLHYTGLKNQNTALYIARHEALCTLDDILRESAKLLKVKGRFYMVHRPFRLPEIMTKMCAYGIEPKRMRLVYPHIDKEPNMVLIEGMKGGNPRMQVEPPLIVYQKDGSYTEELLEMYGMNKSEHKMEE